MLIQLLLGSMGLDCFKLNSTAIYDKQRNVVNFTAYPYQALVGDELKFCTQTMQGKKYNLLITLGSVTFLKYGLTYSNKEAIEERVPCDDVKTNCSFDSVKDIQAASYSMHFTDLNYNVTSIIGSYDIQIYDHMDCLSGAILDYNVKNKIMEMKYTNKALNCTLSGGLYNYTYTSTVSNKPMSFTNAAMSYQTTYMNNILTLDNLVPFALYPIAFSKSNITGKTNPNDFINDLVEIGPISQFTLPVIPTILKQINLNKVNSMYQFLRLTTTISQKVNTSFTQNLTFNTTISYYITKKFNVLQDDCLTNISLLLEVENILFTAHYDKSAKKCGKQYMQSINIDYDRVSFFLQVVQNQDYSGFFFEKDIDIEGYELGSNVDYDMICSNIEECAKYKEVTQLFNDLPNITIVIQQVYWKENEPVFRTTYVPEISVRPFYDLKISMRQQSICFNYQPSSSKITFMNVYIGSYIFKFAYFSSIEQTVYCQPYDGENSNKIKELIANQEYNKESHVYLGQYRLSSVKLVIYYLPELNIIPYYIMGFLFCGILAIFLILVFTPLRIEQMYKG